MPGPTERRARPKVAVVAWDVGHNPLGRAYVLADLLRRRFDVEIWGAQFARYGSRIWAPLRGAAIPVRAFDGRLFPEHLAVMEGVAGDIDADAIFVSKARLPSYALGILATEVANRPLVLDVDDDELAFFGETEGVRAETLQHSRLRANPDLALPFGRAWTRACEPLISAADQLTVSNIALQERYGGLIVPHARDEHTFDPQRYDRAEARRRLGVEDSVRLLLFGGTARTHKGVVEVLEALDRLGDDRYRVAVFGTSVFETTGLDGLREQIGPLERWLLALPNQPFTDLAAVVGAADLACVLQDPAHPVSRSQMPAKVTDALAMAVPCLVTAVPPLRPLIDKGVLHVFDGDVPLEQKITQIFADRDDTIDRARRGREVFLDTYSYAAVREVIEPVFDRLLAHASPRRPELQQLSGVLRRMFPAPASGATSNPAKKARVPGQPVRPVPPGDLYDLVIFWKQNDTSIYGRRQDMFLKYLERTGRFHTIVHFDNPITPEVLVKNLMLAKGAADQRRLVIGQTLKRFLHRRDRGRVRYRTFLYGGRRSGVLPLPKRAAYADYASSVLSRAGVGGRPTVFWVYPTNDDLPDLIDALEPDLVVADVVDDDRTWHRDTSSHYDRIDVNYERVLARSDVVLANCQPVADRMRRFAPGIQVVPNACDLPDRTEVPPRPKQLRAVHGPIIGYVGNLSARIDLELLDAIARRRPHWQFVFVGSAHFDQSILRLDALPNVHFVGVKPYEEARQFVAHFDVGLIPHLDNEMTRSMNPLKAYVYLAAGVPVVSTPIGNLAELADRSGAVTVADGPDAFVDAIEAALRAGKRAPDAAQLASVSWPARVDRVLELIDAAMLSRRRGPG